MVRQLLNNLISLFKNPTYGEYVEKGHKVEIVGNYTDKESGRDKNVILTVQLHEFIPHENFGEAGEFYESTRKRKIKRDRQWTYVDETVTRYKMSPGDKKFVYLMYVKYHLTQEQISMLSGIPQPYVFRYIKHMKFKPQHRKIPKSERKIQIKFSDNGFEFVKKTDEKFEIIFDQNEEVPEIDMDNTDIDFDKDFNLDPFPTASEWKARREELGLKNGENWRNSPLDENPGPRQYGDGSKSARRNLAKLERKEKRKKKNIRKFNSHQNNRYGIDAEHPDGTKDPYKQRREELIRKKNLGKGDKK